MFKGSLLTTLFKDSPFPLQQRMYSESLGKYGGYYHNTTVVPDDVMAKIQDGKAVTILLDNWALYKHQFSLGKEELFSVPVGYYIRSKLPVKEEINQGLLYFQDFGIIWEVQKLSRIFCLML